MVIINNFVKNNRKIYKQTDSIKIMHLYEIKEQLKKKEKAVFTVNEIARIINRDKKIVSVYINRMLKKGLIYRIEKNKISISDDPFIVASQLVFPSYISLNSALYLHNAIQQVIDRIYILTTRKRKSLYFENTKIEFINIKPKFLFGYKKIKKGDSFIMLADLEKAIIDCIRFLRYSNIKDVKNALKNANIKKLEDYINIANSEVIKRRIGYLLDMINKKHSLKRKTNVVYKLNPIIKKKDNFNNKWYLYINEDVN